MEKRNTIRIKINCIGEIDGPSTIKALLYRGGQIFAACDFFHPRGSIELFRTDCEALSKMYDDSKLIWSGPSRIGMPRNIEAVRTMKAIVTLINNNKGMVIATS